MTHIWTSHPNAQKPVEWRLPNGELHREDGPALIEPDGTESWFRHGKLHRDDGPAFSGPEHSTTWYQHGRKHRVDGPADILSPENCRLRQTSMMHIWYLEDVIVDVTLWNFEYGPATELSERQREFIQSVAHGTHERECPSDMKPEMGRQLARGNKAVVGPEALVFFSQLKAWPTIGMLKHKNRTVRGVAAWHLPFDDNYLDAALENPSVRDVMVHRADIPEHVRCLMDVAS